MENASKLMMIGFMATLFATALLVTGLMYYETMDIVDILQDRHMVRSVMEDD